MDSKTRAAINHLMKRLQQGDRTASAELFRLLWPALRIFCGRCVRGEAQAEDAAQRAIVKVFEQASHFDAGRDALAWALEIALWECRTERRRHGRSHEARWTSEAEQIAEKQPTPEERLEAVELSAALQAALEALPELDRETLRLHLLETEAPIAPATWRKRKERALGRLRLMWRSLYGLE